MSRLGALIQQLCPDGVEYRPIKEEYQRLKGIPITAAKMKEIERPDGNIRIFAGGKTVVDAYEEDIPKANIIRVPAVLVQSRGVIDAVYFERPFTFKNEMWAYTHENKIAVKFLYYILKNNIETFREVASSMGSLPQISLKVTENFKMPIPPLEVQREIVRILDQFTDLTAELTAELTAREKQYEYYRDKVLTFDNSFPVVALSGLCDIGDGLHGTPTYDNNGEYYFINGNNLSNGKIVFDAKTKKIQQIEYEKVKIQFGQTLLFSINGTIGKIAIYNNEKIALGKSVAYFNIVSDRLMLKYLFYVLQSYQSMIYFEKNLTGSTIKNLGLKALRDYQITLPPIKIQKKIISILDRFDTLCNDLTSGLPAEIEARRKQYEYYRDKLLTFKEL